MSNTLWYPYTAMFPAPDFPVVKRAQGTSLFLEDGRELIDGISSWWAVIHGYNHPVLNAAISDQVSKMAHVMLGGLTHQPALDLAQRLVDITPVGLNHVFFSDSGSVGVEVALKMALQFWLNQGLGGKTQFLAFDNAYHGDTFGAMSVCDPIDSMHHLFSGQLSQHRFCPTDADAVEALLKDHHQTLAAVIIEPLLQAAGGFKLHSPQFLRDLRQLCDRYNVLLIFDEVATGFGRTGSLFAADQAGICPDLMVLGKALTGGYIGHAATLATTSIFNTFQGDSNRILMHGPTFGGNPLACAVALASLDVFFNDHYLDAIQALHRQLQEGLEAIHHPDIVDKRCIGAVGVLEMSPTYSLKKIQDHCLNNGVWLRPFGSYLYIMPAYTLRANDLATLLGQIATGL
ncbi:MAG: adenosylmethionine--8-amino-7-oxononanoate transaminase [Candidatus Margulisiibacteriota bacterium]